MKLKLNEDGSAVVQDGKPVYIYEDGKEVPFDAGSATRRISHLLEEKERHYESAKAVKAELEKYAAIEDPEAALAALATVQNFNDKDFVAAGEVEKLKSQLSEMFDKEKKQIADTFTKEISGLSHSVEEKDNVIRKLMVGGQFATSPWFSGEKPKTILPPDIAAEHFGKFFKVEGEGDDVAVVGYLNGNKILSRENVGNPAGFEEALSVIIENYPQRDRILRETVGGSGSTGNTGGGGKGSVTRAVFDRMAPSEQAALIRSGATLTD